MLFDTLKFHGAAFTPPFWARVFDSVLLPIFDHVRAEARAPPPAPAGPSSPCAGRCSRMSARRRKVAFLAARLLHVPSARLRSTACGWRAASRFIWRQSALRQAGASPAVAPRASARA